MMPNASSLPREGFAVLVQAVSTWLSHQPPEGRAYVHVLGWHGSVE